MIIRVLALGLVLSAASLVAMPAISVAAQEGSVEIERHDGSHRGVILAVVLAAAGILAVYVTTAGRGASHRREGAAWGEMDVAGVVLAVDRRAREHVRAEVERALGEPASPGKHLRALALALRRNDACWAMAGVINATPASEDEARRTFERARDDAEQRFEAVGDGLLSETGLDPETGGGLSVVTLVAAARRELLDVHDFSNADALRELLNAMVGLEDDAVADVAIVWSPADPSRALTMAELREHYDHLLPIDDASRRPRVYCNNCDAPRYEGITTCPFCGARESRPAPS